MHNESWAESGVREGDILAEKYRVERVLGVGGMGAVVAARHLQLDEQVAIKLLLPGMIGDPGAIARFLREARAAVRIKSEHVARVLDVGTLPNGGPFMVMELLEGADLTTWLRQRGALPIAQAVDFVLQACVAVADAHGMGIVHRDLKPSNLFCVRRSDGQLVVKVLDFGISKVTEPTGSMPSISVTQTGAVMGSPLYMSPEQMRSTKDAGPQSDIWSLGVILFELVTGRLPFMAETFADMAVRVATESPPRLRDLRSDVPPGLEAAVHRCLAREPRARYRDVGELAEALAPFGPTRARSSVERVTGIMHATGFSERAFDAPPPALAGTLPAPQTAPPIGRTNAPPPRARRTALVTASLGAAALAILAIFGVAVLGRSAGRRAGAAGTPAVAPVASSVAIAAIVPSSVAPSSAPATPPPAASTAIAVPEASSSSAPLASSAPSSRPSPPARTAPKAAAVRCDPPYYFDAKGTRIFKKECL